MPAGSDDAGRLERKVKLLTDKLAMQAKQHDLEEEDRCNALQTTLRNHARELAEREVKFCELQAELDQSKVELYSANLRSTEHEEVGQGELEELATLRGEATVLRQEAAGLQQETAGLRQETAGLRQEAAGQPELMQAIEQRDTVMKMMRDELAEAEEKVKQRDAVMVSMRDELSAAETSASAQLATAGEARQEELKQLKNKYAILNKRVLEERKAMAEEKSRAAAELKKWQGKCTGLEREIEALSDNMDDQVEGTAQKGENTLDTLDTINTKLSDSSKELRKAQRALEAKGKDCLRKEARIEKLNAALLDAQNQSFGLDCSGTGDAAADTIEELEQKLIDQGQLLATKSKEVAKRDKKIGALEAKLRAGQAEPPADFDRSMVDSAAQEQVEVLEAELAKKTKEHQSQLAGKTREITKRDKKIKSLEASAQDASSDGGEDSEAMEAAEAKIEGLETDLQSEKKEKAKEKAKVTKKIAALEKSLASSKGQAESSEAELAEANTELESLREKLLRYRAAAEASKAKKAAAKARADAKEAEAQNKEASESEEEEEEEEEDEPVPVKKPAARKRAAAPKAAQAAARKRKPRAAAAKQAPANDENDVADSSMSMSMRLKTTSAEGDGHDFKSALAKLYQNKRPAGDTGAAKAADNGKKQRKLFVDRRRPAAFS